MRQFGVVTDATTTTCVCGARSAHQELAASERRFGLGGVFRVVRCTQCDTVRTDPAPDDPGAYYPAGSYYAYKPPTEPAGRARARFRPGYTNGRPTALRRRLIRGAPTGRPGKILDVGCGSGAFLLGLKTAGWDVHGIEPDPQSAAAAREAGLDVITGDLTATDVGGDYDVVRFWHSLEHAPDPAAQLQAALSALKPGGKLIVGVPNYASALARVARGKWFSLDLPRHLWHFEPATLRALAAQAGFTVETVDHVSTGQSILGTLDYMVGRGERLCRSRVAWHAATPAAIMLDKLGRGDALELRAMKPLNIRWAGDTVETVKEVSWPVAFASVFGLAIKDEILGRPRRGYWLFPGRAVDER